MVRNPLNRLKLVLVQGRLVVYFMDRVPSCLQFWGRAESYNLTHEFFFPIQINTVSPFGLDHLVRTNVNSFSI